MKPIRRRLLTRITPPASEPLSLTETKLYLRVDHASEDMLINDLIVAARMSAEDWLKRSLITQIWKLAYDDYISETVTLPMGPVNNVTAVTIINRDSTTQTVPNTSYYLNASGSALISDVAIFGFRVEITYSAGYGISSSVPKPIKQGMLAHIAAMYDSRGDMGDAALPDQTLRLYLPFREVHL